MEPVNVYLAQQRAPMKEFFKRVTNVANLKDHVKVCFKKKNYL